MSSSSSSSSSGQFYSIWPQPRFDNQGTGNTGLSDPGYDLRLAAIPLQYGVNNYYHVSPMVLAYSDHFGYEVIYCIGYRLSTDIRALAFSSHDGSLLWASDHLAGLSTTNSGLSISTDRKSLYCSSGGKIFSINLNDGSIIWTWTQPTIPSAISSTTSRATYDGTGSLFVGAVVLFASAARFYTFQINATDGSNTSSNYGSTQIGVSGSAGIMGKSIVLSPDNSYAYCCGWYGDSVAGSYYTRILKITTSNNALSTISLLIDGITEGRISTTTGSDGIAYNNNKLYITSESGLFAANPLSATQSWHYNQTLTYPTDPAISDSGIIYYRSADTVYAVQDDGLSYTSLWSTSGLQSSNTRNTPIIIEQNGNLITASSNTAGNNYVTLDTSGDTVSEYSLYNSSTRTISHNPIIGSHIDGGSNNLYVPYLDTSAGNLGYIFILYDSGGISSESSTSESSASSYSSYSTQSGESESTQSETTSQSEVAPTTTTTTLSPLAIVQTTYHELKNNVYVSDGTSNASNDSGTKSTVSAKSPTFGTISPGQTSSTIVISLSVPDVIAIKNIKIGLINSGGITFSNDVFGIATSSELRSDIEPDTYFQGVNTSGLITSSYNIAVPNKDKHSSTYVYLNAKLQSSKTVGTGLVKYSWFFDYAD